MLRRTVRRRNLVADMVTELKHHLIAHLVTNTLSVEYMRYTAILRSEVASSRSTSMKRSLRLIAWRQRQSALMTTLMKTLEDVNRLNQKIPQLAAQVERDNAMAIMIAEQEIEDAEIAEQEENIQARKRRKRRRADELILGFVYVLFVSVCVPAAMMNESAPPTSGSVYTRLAAGIAAATGLNDELIGSAC